MSPRPLDFDFPLMSEISRRPPHAVAHDELLPEIEAELADRRAFYARMVARAKMERADADRHIDLLAAIRDDLLFVFVAGSGWPGARHGWDAKVRELRRELAIRRNAWPRRIASAADPLDAATATARMERLEAVHFKYWIDLFGIDTEVAGLPLEQGRERIRAEQWLRWHWQRGQLAAGHEAARCVPPDDAAFLRMIDAGAPLPTSLWHDFGDAARRLGLAPRAEIAA